LPVCLACEILLLVRDLPTGTVTFLFTDVEGSTRLLHELGDAYADVRGNMTRRLPRVPKTRAGPSIPRRITPPCP